MRSLALAAALLLVACSEDPSTPNDFQLVYEAGAVTYSSNSPMPFTLPCSEQMPTSVRGDGNGSSMIEPRATGAECVVDGDSISCSWPVLSGRSTQLVVVHADREAADATIVIPDGLTPGSFGCTGTVEATIVPIE